MIGIVIGGEIKGGTVFRAHDLEFFLQADGDSLSVQRIGFGKHDAKELVGEPIDGIRGPQSFGHSLGCITERGFLIVARAVGARVRLGEHHRKGLLHAKRPAKFHAEAIPEVILIRHGVEQVRAGLDLEGNVTLEFGEQVLLELGKGALAIEKVADEKDCKCAESEEGNAHGPFVLLRMNENERIHKAGQPACKDENKDGGEDGELEIAAFQTVQLLAVDRGHGVTCKGQLAREAGSLELPGIHTGSVLGRASAIDMGYRVMKEARSERIWPTASGEPLEERIA